MPEQKKDTQYWIGRFNQEIETMKGRIGLAEARGVDTTILKAELAGLVSQRDDLVAELEADKPPLDGVKSTFPGEEDI